MASRHLLVFTRWPAPGRTKTRLSPALGAEGAARLQEWLTGHTLLQTRIRGEEPEHQVRVFHTGASARRFRRWLGPDVRLFIQATGDLGDRLSAATARSFREGAARVVVIGIDCPAIGPEEIARAFAVLDRHDAVLIPAPDGGYALLGCRSPSPQLFRDIPWGGEEVLDRTRDRLRRLDWSFKELSRLPDIDEAEDLPHLDAFRAAETRPGLSVVIPARNEEERIASAVTAALREADEVIVADAHSRDRTVELAEAAGARVVPSAPGRSRQMNLAARVARYDTLWFVHADAEVSEGAGERIREVLQAPGVVLAALRLRIRGGRPAYRILERGVALRTRLLHRPYGDQALAIKRETFVRLGGYADLPLLEDLDLVRRTLRRGRLAALPEAVVVSDRRWRTRGLLRTTLLNQAILLADALGVSARTLAAWYR